MKIRITPERAVKIKDALEAVNGRAGAHTVNYWGTLVEFTAKADDQLQALRGRDRVGAVAHCIPSGPWSRSYKYDAISTRVELTRCASGWFLTGVERVTVRPVAKELVRLTLSHAQVTAISNHATARFNVV